MVQLTQRHYAAATFLVNQMRPVTVKEMSRHFHISERTMRYDLDVLEDWFREQGVTLNRKSRVGVYIDRDTAEFLLLKQSLTEPAELQQVYSSKERQELIRSILLEGNQVYTIGELAEKINVSKSTVTSELNEVEGWLNKYGVKLIRRSNYGVKIECEEENLRKAIVNHLYEVYSKDRLLQLLNLTKMDFNKSSRISYITKDKLLELFENVDIEKLEACISNIEIDLNSKFTDTALVGLLVHLGLVMKRIRMGKEIVMPVEQLDSIRKLPEFAISAKGLKEIEKISDVIFPDAEIGYFTIHLLGSSIKKKYFEQEDGIVHSIEKLVDVIKEMAGELSHRLGIDLTGDQELLEGLLIHIKPALSRLRFQIYMENPILKDIKEQYPTVFQEVQQASKLLERQFDCLLNEDEVSYIAMHVAAAIQRSTKDDNKKIVRAAVVCSTGVGTAKLLSARIKKEFNQITVMKEMSLLEFDQFDKSSVDVIFTTIPVDTAGFGNVIYVNTLLTEKDKYRIMEFLRLFFGRKENENRYVAGYVTELMKVIEKSCLIQDRGQLEQDLSQFLCDMKTVNTGETKGEVSLADLLTAETVRANVSAGNWKEAISAGGRLLLKEGAIKAEYIDSMVETVLKFKSHIVIAPGVAMPHAMPGGNVKRACMSLITLKNPVSFGHPENDPVKLVLCLGIVDEISHIKPLYEFMEFLEDRDRVERVFGAKNEKQLLKALLDGKKLEKGQEG